MLQCMIWEMLPVWGGWMEGLSSNMHSSCRNISFIVWLLLCITWDVQWGGLAVSLVGGKIHWMGGFDLLFCVKAENVRNSLWIQHVFHRIITSIEGMLHSNPCNQFKLRFLFFFLGKVYRKKKFAVPLNDSSFLNSLFVNTSVRDLGNWSV